MRWKLTYQVGQKVVQEWILTSQSLAYWKKQDLLKTGQYQLGKFKVTPIDSL
jgi:hypothetical protein